MMCCTQKNLIERGGLRTFVILVISLAIITSISSAITYVGVDDEGYRIFSGDTLTARVNLEDNSMYINNMFKIRMFPQIYVGNQMMQATQPKYTNPLVGSKLTVFEIDYPEGFLSDVYASSRVEISDKKVVQTVHVENTKDSEVTVKILVSNDNKTVVVYAPFIKDRTKDFMVMSPIGNGIYGRILVVYFSPVPPSFIPITQIATVKPSDQMVWLIKIPAKSKYTLKITYLSGYLAQTDVLNNYPVKSAIDKEPFLISDSDPLMTFYHTKDFSKIMPKLDLSKPGLDILKQIKDYVNALPSSNPEFGLTSYEDWSLLSNAQQYNSLEKALIFRKICREVGIPARLHIGKKREGNYYAWVTAYVGGIEEVYDPFNKMSEYPEVYTEPMPYLCKDDVSLCRFEQIIKPGVVCLGPMCFNVVLIAAIIVLFVMSGLGLVMYKSDVLMRMLSQSPQKIEHLDGTYTILEEPKALDNPLFDEVFRYIKENNGLVDITQISHTLGYSKIVVISAIEWLIENKIITKA